MEWISVNDRLPENVEDVLIVYDKSVYVGVWWPDSAVIFANQPGMYDDTIPKNEVTHWMPLPPPPTVTK